MYIFSVLNYFNQLYKLLSGPVRIEEMYMYSATLSFEI